MELSSDYEVKWKFRHGLENKLSWKIVETRKNRKNRENGNLLKKLKESFKKFETKWKNIKSRKYYEMSWKHKMGMSKFCDKRNKNHIKVLSEKGEEF